MRITIVVGVELVVVVPKFTSWPIVIICTLLFDAYIADTNPRSFILLHRRRREEVGVIDVYPKMHQLLKAAVVER